MDSGQLDRDLDGFQSEQQRVRRRATRPFMTSWRGSKPRTGPALNPERDLAGSPPRNGHLKQKGNGHSPATRGDRTRIPRPATPNQVKAILAISRKQDTDLAGLLRREYEVARPEDLDSPGDRAYVRCILAFSPAAR